jgi:hypothetical protein
MDRTGSGLEAVIASHFVMTLRVVVNALSHQRASVFGSLPRGVPSEVEA